MEKSLAIARLAGPVFSAIGIGMLTNHGVYRQVAAQILAGYPFIYFSGILLLLGGLAILNTHNNWTRDWRSVITLLGWIAMTAGSFRIIAPQFSVFIGTGAFAHDGFLTGVGIVLLALGGFLTFKGYAA
jgi:hypothetical protein